MLSFKEKKQWVKDHKKELIRWNRVSYSESVKQLRELEKEIVRLTKEFNRKVEDKRRVKKIKKSEPIKYEELTEKDFLKICKDKYAMSKESAGGVDLRPYLKKIRNHNEGERELVLLIKNGKVIYETIKVHNNRSYFNPLIIHENFIKKAKKLKAAVYQAHNHPYSFAAKASSRDARTYKTMKKLYQNYGVELLDMGVVTMDDYLSLDQKLKEVERLKKKYKTKIKDVDIIFSIIELMHVTGTKRMKSLNILACKQYMSDDSKEIRTDLSKVEYNKLRNKAVKIYEKNLEKTVDKK